MTNEKVIDLNIEDDVEFEFFKFQWNRYELDDGTVLKICNIPVKILRLKERDPQGQPKYMVVSANKILTAHVKLANRGPPSMEKFNPKTDIMNDIEFQHEREPWNEFQLSDGYKLRTKLIITKVKVSEKRNQFGEFIYYVNSSLNVTTSPNT